MYTLIRISKKFQIIFRALGQASKPWRIYKSSSYCSKATRTSCPRVRTPVL